MTRGYAAATTGDRRATTAALASCALADSSTSDGQITLVYVTEHGHSWHAHVWKHCDRRHSLPVWRTHSGLQGHRLSRVRGAFGARGLPRCPLTVDCRRVRLKERGNLLHFRLGKHKLAASMPGCRPACMEWTATDSEQGSRDVFKLSCERWLDKCQIKLWVE